MLCILQSNWLLGVGLLVIFRWGLGTQKSKTKQTAFGICKNFLHDKILLSSLIIRLHGKVIRSRWPRVRVNEPLPLRRMDSSSLVCKHGQISITPDASFQATLVAIQPIFTPCILSFCLLFSLLVLIHAASVLNSPLFYVLV